MLKNLIITKRGDENLIGVIINRIIIYSCI